MGSIMRPALARILKLAPDAPANPASTAATVSPMKSVAMSVWEARAKDRAKTSTPAANIII